MKGTNLEEAKLEQVRQLVAANVDAARVQRAASAGLGADRARLEAIARIHELHAEELQVYQALNLEAPDPTPTLIGRMHRLWTVFRKGLNLGAPAPALLESARAETRVREAYQRALARLRWGPVAATVERHLQMLERTRQTMKYLLEQPEPDTG